MDRALRDEIEPFQLGQALDEPADVMAEKPVDLLSRRIGILDRVVQDRRDDRRIVELEIGQYRGDFERMREIRIARCALLRAMRLHRIDIGAVEQVFVDMRIIAPHSLDEFVLPHHGRYRFQAWSARQRPDSARPVSQCHDLTRYSIR